MIFFRPRMGLFFSIGKRSVCLLGIVSVAIQLSPIAPSYRSLHLEPLANECLRQAIIPFTFTSKKTDTRKEQARFNRLTPAQRPSVETGALATERKPWAPDRPLHPFIKVLANALDRPLGEVIQIFSDAGFDSDAMEQHLPLAPTFKLLLNEFRSEIDGIYQGPEYIVLRFGRGILTRHEIFLFQPKLLSREWIMRPRETGIASLDRDLNSGYSNHPLTSVLDNPHYLRKDFIGPGQLFSTENQTPPTGHRIASRADSAA
jgi:hypothetical protein